MRLILAIAFSLCAPLAAQAATMLTIGSGSAIRTVDRSATFDSVITPTGASGLTGVGLDYEEDGISVSTSGNPWTGYLELSYSPKLFNGKESGGFYYPNGGSRDPIKITNNWGMQAVEVLIGTGWQSIPGFADITWTTYGGPDTKSTGMARVPLGTVVGFWNIHGFETLLLGSNTGNVLAIDNLLIQDTEANIVPLPAGMPLVATGLGAFALLRRKRKQKAA